MLLSTSVPLVERKMSLKYKRPSCTTSSIDTSHLPFTWKPRRSTHVTARTCSTTNPLKI